MNFDPKEHAGKLKALESSFLLMADMTGKAPTPRAMNFHLEHYVRQGLSMHDVNLGVLEVMKSWQAGYWPTPEVIEHSARAIQRQNRKEHSVGYDPTDEIEDISLRARDSNWLHRSETANAWREANPARFRSEVMPKVNAEVQFQSARIKRMREGHAYREAFREGATVQACNNRAGEDERRAARLHAEKIDREARHFAATGAMPDAESPDA